MEISVAVVEAISMAVACDSTYSDGVGCNDCDDGGGGSSGISSGGTFNNGGCKSDGSDSTDSGDKGVGRGQ